MLYLDNIVFSLQKTGGISVVWQNLISTCINRELNFKCIEYKGALNNLQRKDLFIPNCHLTVYNQNPLFSRFFDYNHSKKPGVFHSSYYRLMKGAKNITTVHDFTYELFKKGLKAKIHNWQKCRAIRNSDVIVCISQNTKMDLLRLMPDIPEGRIRIIYNGVSSGFNVISNKDTSLSDCVLFIGSRDYYKNFEFTVRTVKETNLRLLIVGRPLLNEERILLNNELGENKYLERNYVSEDELNQIYNSVYCLMYPSSYEGFGIPVLEAQRAGCPVIALNASSIPEIIGETPLLLDKLNIDEAKEKLLLAEEQRVQISANGLINSQSFSWDKMGEEYLSLYKELE